MKFNLDQKSFWLLENTNNGAVDSKTTFHYRQNEDVITATYSGGSIIEGQIIGQFIQEDQLNMRYHCITSDKTIKVGKAQAQLSLNNDDLIVMKLDWEWMGENPSKGSSVYLEHE